MSMKVKLLSMLAAMVMVAGLMASCNSGDSSKTSSDDKSSSTTTTVATDENGSTLDPSTTGTGTNTSVATDKSGDKITTTTKKGTTTTKKKNKDDDVRNLKGRTIRYSTYWAEFKRGSTEQANNYWKVKTQVQKNYNVVWKHTFETDTKNWFSKMVTTILSGKPSCDVFSAPAENMYPAIGNGVLQNLSALDEFDFSETKWFRPVMDQGKVNGKNYAMLSSNGETHNVVLYNKKLFNQAKQEDLYTLQKQGKLTLDKFYSIANGLRKALPTSTAVIAPMTYTFNFYNMLVMAYGGQIVGRTANTLKFQNKVNSNAVTKAYNQASSMMKNGLLLDTSKSTDWQYSRNQFVNGKAAIYIAGTDMQTVFQNFKGNANDVGMCLMPTSSGGTLIDQSGSMWCGIPRNVTKPDDVALVFDKMTNVIFTTDYVLRYQDYLPAQAMEVMKTIATQTQKGNYKLDYLGSLDLWSNQIGDQFMLMVDGTNTPAQTIQKVEPLITTRINQMVKGK